ncbi:uncharacterized protein lrrc41 isoform X2 [Echeneis naucrates]|uniref:Leucine-rich repeat-containing protein 41 n=1 Tax=Echeneis naucrates TaxID=173247 RepID=A0A665T6P0_ECHNA|nr:leucine-rich repeat-containing protein 41 isoform X2 [Echeneis naucrates]
MCETAHRTKPTEPKMCLKEICYHAVRKHFAALDINAVLDLPVPLIKGLLPHLTVCQLDELQPQLNLRGISTLSGWAGILRDLCGPNRAADFHTEEDAKHEVMRMLFILVFYGIRSPFVNRNSTNLNTQSFIIAAAKCIKHFLLTPSVALQSLTADQRPLLNLLEERIRSVGVTQSIDLSKSITQTALYVLHRLLDHGVAQEIVIDVDCPITLAWLLHGRGSQHVSPEFKNLMQSKKEGCVSHAASALADTADCGARLDTRTSRDEYDDVTPHKRSKMDLDSMQEESGKTDMTVDPQALCQIYLPCDGLSAGACQWGQIHRLEMRYCGSDSLRVLNSALPTFFCLCSLSLHSLSTFRDSDVLGLARALKQLSESSHSSLRDINIGILPYTKLMETLLNASPEVMSLHVEIQTVVCRPDFPPHHPRIAESENSELPLQKLTVKLTELQTDLQIITSVLRRTPHLTSLHITGMRLPTGSSLSPLFTTLSEVTLCLRSLTLEDMKLSDCLPEILNLLKDCKLEELHCNDCRLLEQWDDKEKSLQELVAAVKSVPSLHTLGLAQNRLAKNVCVLAELFSGSSKSSVKQLNISSNFIQPAELLQFAERLRTDHPRHRLTLDLRKNPGDRDPNTWKAALKTLRPFCALLVEEWKSTDTMVDHISNM